MHLTRFTDNALRCLLHLGVTPERRSTIGEVAASMAMSEDHLTKVVQRLAQRGYVQTIRGRKGGVRLAKLPADIVVGAVVRDTEQDCSLVRVSAIPPRARYRPFASSPPCSPTRSRRFCTCWTARRLAISSPSNSRCAASRRSSLVRPARPAPNDVARRRWAY